MVLSRRPAQEPQQMSQESSQSICHAPISADGPHPSAEKSGRVIRKS
jgi:hypothetical protein